MDNKELRKLLNDYSSELWQEIHKIEAELEDAMSETLVVKYIELKEKFDMLLKKVIAIEEVRKKII